MQRDSWGDTGPRDSTHADQCVRRRREEIQTRLWGGCLGLFIVPLEDPSENVETSTAEGEVSGWEAAL